MTKNNCKYLRIATDDATQIKEKICINHYRNEEHLANGENYFASKQDIEGDRFFTFCNTTENCKHCLM